MPSVAIKSHVENSTNGHSKSSSLNGNPNDAPMSEESSFERAKQLVERKIRNLEKRKSKLEHARLDLEAGKSLKEDQIKAVQCLTEVDIQISTAKDIIRSLKQLNDDIHKETFTEKMRHCKHIGVNTNKQKALFSVLLQIKELFLHFGKESVRNDFRNGIPGAKKLNDEQIELIDFCHKNMFPNRNLAQDKKLWIEITEKAGSFIENILERSESLLPNKQITFAEMTTLLDDVCHCGYFERILCLTTKPEIPLPDSGTSSSVSAQLSPDGFSDQQQKSPDDVTSTHRSMKHRHGRNQAPEKAPHFRQGRREHPVADPQLAPPLPVLLRSPPAAAGVQWSAQPQPPAAHLFFPTPPPTFFTPAHHQLPLLPICVPISLEPVANEIRDDFAFPFDNNNEQQQFFPFVDQQDFMEPPEIYYEEQTFIQHDPIDTMNGEFENLNFDESSNNNNNNKALDPNAPAFVPKMAPTTMDSPSPGLIHYGVEQMLPIVDLNSPVYCPDMEPFGCQNILTTDGFLRDPQRHIAETRVAESLTGCATSTCNPDLPAPPQFLGYLVDARLPQPALMVSRAATGGNHFPMLLLPTTTAAEPMAPNRNCPISDDQMT